MAFAATVEWEVRTTGSDSNGGGFDPTSGVPGTDYSQQDSPQVTYTDLVIDGTTNTKCTSAGNPFTSAHVGNIINITSGTGFTVQRVQVMSVSAAVATCDKSLGTLGSTGGNGKLGGGLLTCGAAVALLVTGNVVHVKSGTYTLTAELAPNVLSSWVGYQTSHYDRTGTRPLITTSTNNTNIFTAPNGIRVLNISMSNTAGTRAYGIASSSTGSGLCAIDCVFDGFKYAMLGDNSLVNAGTVYCLRSEVKNCTVGGVLGFYQVEVFGSYLHNNTGSAIAKSSSSNQTLAVTRCIIANNTIGIDATNAGSVLFCENNAITGNSSHGIDGVGNFAIIVNNIIYNNGGYGVNGSVGSSGSYLAAYNALGSNTSGNYNPAALQAAGNRGDITLTATPFTNSGAGDYTLNNTAGGGAACKNVGFQWGQ